MPFLYFLAFHCAPRPSVVETDTFTWGVQIGHCHEWPVCSRNTTFGDESATLIPMRKSGPGAYTPSATLGGNAGFESGWGDWILNNQDPASGKVCNNPNPFQGSCYLFLRPQNSNNTMTLRMTHDLTNDFLARAETYSEFEARCPTAWNNGDCRARVKIEPLDNNNNPTASEEVGAWKTIPESDTDWTAIRLELTGGNVQWPDGTKKWRFKLEFDSGDSADVDWHQQMWGDIN